MAGSGIGQLLKDVGNNLSANEARRIAKATGTTPEQVYAAAERRGAGIAPSAQKQYGGSAAPASTSSTRSSSISSSTSSSGSTSSTRSSSTSSSTSSSRSTTSGNSGGSGIGQLLKDVGNNLSANEARRIAKATGTTPEQVYAAAERRGAGIAPSAQKQYGGSAASASGSAEIDTLNRRIDELTSENYGLTSDLDKLTSENYGLTSDLDYLTGQIGYYESELSAYMSRFDEVEEQYQNALSQTQSAQSQLGSARSQAEAEKKRADELEQMRADERELSISQQLGGLRSGSTVSGSGSTGLGSLSSGAPSYSISTGGKSGGVLDRAYQDIDPTDSVLNKDVAVASLQSSTGSSSATEARQRALASGASLSSYYAQRFG